MTEPKSDHFFRLTHPLAELCSAEDMEMQMLYRLAGIGAAVCDNAVTAREIFGLGDLGDGFKDLRNECAVFRSDFIDGRNMFLRHDEDMYGCLRIYITESIDIFVFKNLRRGYVALDDFAEKAVHQIN